MCRKNNIDNKEISDKKEQQPEKKQEEEVCEIDELTKLNVKYEELWDKYVRLCAEFDNTRKRWERERTEIIRFANFSLLRDLIVVLDEMEHALAAVKQHANIEEVVKGLEMTYNNFWNALKRSGVLVVEAKGKKFDPHVHEIIASRETEDEEEHIILEEVQKGYLFEDKLLRTAKVIVSVKKKPDEQKENTQQQEN